MDNQNSNSDPQQENTDQEKVNSLDDVFAAVTEIMKVLEHNLAIGLLHRPPLVKPGDVP